MAAGSKVKDGLVTKVLLWWEASPEERKHMLVSLAAGVVVGAIFGIIGCAIGRSRGGILEMIDTSASALVFAIFFVLAIGAMVASVFVGSFLGGRLGGLVASGTIGTLGGLFAGMITGSYWGAPLAAAILAGAAGPLTASKIPTVTGREFSAYFYSPMAYVITLAFAALVGAVGFYHPLTFPQPIASMLSVFGLTMLLLPVLGPLITMRQFAEETKTGTIEVLTTAPVTDAEVVLGKFFGSLLVFAVMMLPTAFYLGTLFLLSAQGPDMGPVLGGYLVIFLSASMFISLGLLASSITRDQVVSFILGFSLSLGVLFFVVTRRIFPIIARHERLDDLVSYLNFWEQFDPFVKGIIDTKGLVYFTTTTAFIIFLTIKLVGWRKGRG